VSPLDDAALEAGREELDLQRFTIACEDAIDFMRSRPGSSAHLLLTDPPYCSGSWQESKQMQNVSTGESESERRDWFAADSMSTAGLVFLLRTMMHETHRVLVHGGHALVFCDWRLALTLAPALESTGMRLQNWIVWDKLTAGMGEHFRAQHETILHFAKGVARRGEWSGKYGNRIEAARVVPSRKLHPTEKPTALLEILIRVCTFPGETVIDPFLGAGSTMVAARNVERRCAGSDHEPRFVLTSRERAGVELGPLFANVAGETVAPSAGFDHVGLPGLLGERLYRGCE
jgi:site-specific DNA-methyltransferase (adenine-specific)